MPALPLRTPPDFAARRDGTYLVTGGLDGFGFEAARWLVAHGAGSIALLGRRGSADAGMRGAGRRARSGRRRGSRSIAAMSPIAPASSAILDRDPGDAAAIARGGARRLGDRRRARRRYRPRRRRADPAAEARRRARPRPVDPRGPDRAVSAVLLGDDTARRPGPGRLCRGECGARGARPAAPRRGPTGARHRLGSDRGCRLSGEPARNRATRWRGGSAPSRSRPPRPWRVCRR